MYGVSPDPYCYPGTKILKNRLDIRDPDELQEFETASTLQRASEPLPHGRLGATHYKAIHRHLFQDVYRWAGKYRSVVLGKGGSLFCLPENVAREMVTLFAQLQRRRYLRDLTGDAFAVGAAAFLATLNAIHPFREGNGRTQMSFMTVLAARACHPLLLDRLEPVPFLEAMVQSFHDEEGPLTAQIFKLIA